MSIVCDNEFSGYMGVFSKSATFGTLLHPFLYIAVELKNAFKVTYIP